MAAIVTVAVHDRNENPRRLQSYFPRECPHRHRVFRHLRDLSRTRGSDWRPGSGSRMKKHMPRPLTTNEHELIEALLGAVRSGVGRYIGQLESAEVVGGCGCGCPSIDLVVGSKSGEGRAKPVILADAESPEGVPVGIILWARDGRLSGLEVHPWDGSVSVRLPHPETLQNLRTGG